MPSHRVLLDGGPLGGRLDFTVEKVGGKLPENQEFFDAETWHKYRLAGRVANPQRYLAVYAYVVEPGE